MRPVLFVLAATATLAMLFAHVALAKGASEATIAGPGLDRPLSLRSDEAGGLLEGVAGEAGFFPAVFVQSPDPMRDSRPAGTLGPKYTISYVMPGPNGEEDTIHQDVYPYASPAPVSHVEPGQPFWTTERTRGGWFVARSHLRDLLVAAGLPESPTALEEPTPSDSSWTALAPFALVAVAAALAGIATLAVRRGPRAA